jgi:hypothetical protein
MALSAFITAVRRHLVGSAWNPLARGAWCRKQRRHLSPTRWCGSGAMPRRGDSSALATLVSRVNRTVPA